MSIGEVADSDVTANDDVGMSLMAGEETDAIVAILQERLGDRLRVTDHITYVKIETDVGQLEVEFSEVAEELGRTFGLSEFQVIFSSYYGRPHVLDHMIGVYSSMTAGVLTGEDEGQRA